MKITMRAKGKIERQWKKVSDREYRDEAHLQRLLYESPDLIPIEDLGEGTVGPRLFIKEVGLPGSGRTDLIGVDEIGGITVVECKLATNPDIRRKVIGQVLEYAAYLWQMPYDKFDSIVQSREGQPLAKLMRQRLDEQGPVEDWQEEKFRDSVVKTLRQGTFRIIVAVDKVTDELRRVIRYLNASGPVGFSIYALEMHYFADDQTELLVPQLVGMVPQRPTAATGKRGRWDTERFFQASAAEESNSSEVIQVMRDLLEFTEQEADKVWWGTGNVNGSYSFHLLQNDGTASLFSVFTYGTIKINLGGGKHRVPESLWREWIVTLRKIQGFRTLRDSDLGKWPAFPLSRALSNVTDVEQFKQSVLTIKEAIRCLD